MYSHFEIEPNQFVVRFYDQNNADDYVASALVRCYGDRGWMSSIIGPTFYKFFRLHAFEIMAAAKTKTLEGYMTDAHARLLRMQFRNEGKVEILWRGECAGRDMPWVCLTRLDNDVHFV